MFHRRLVRTAISVSIALLLGVAGTANAKTYSLAAGSGGQTHIGNGLALPIQPAATSLVTGTVLPPLLIPVRSTPGEITVQGTTAMASQQQITVPTAALSKKPAQNTVGVFQSNPTLYAVGTSLGFQWPAQAAVFNTTARTGASTVIFPAPWGQVRYSVPVLAAKFGGPAQFAINATPGSAGGLNAAAPVTIWAVAVPGAGNPPCTHTALTPVPFPGTFASPACVGAILHAVPTGGVGAGLGAGGASVGAPLITTAGGVGGLPPMSPGVVIGKFGPIGTKFLTASTGGMMSGGKNNATSKGFPFTAGRITISATMTAALGTEKFVLEGKDARTAGGEGTIQMVAGAVSTRVLSGTNANRQWVRLVLGKTLAEVPALAPAMRGVAIGLIMLTAVGIMLRLRKQSQTA